MLLQAGMDAPRFELFDADMKLFSLAAQLGKKNVVLYFYPKDGTPGCTMEANEFSDLDDKFKRFDTLVVGVSRDECLSHTEFRDKYGFSVLLLSDSESIVCKKYGVLYDKEASLGDTTDRTASHLTKLSKDDSKVIGYSHSTKLSENDSQIAGNEQGRRVDSHNKVAIQRSTFVIDKQGKLCHVLYGVHAHGHAIEILKLVEELK